VFDVSADSLTVLLESCSSEIHTTSTIIYKYVSEIAQKIRAIIAPLTVLDPVSTSAARAIENWAENSPKQVMCLYGSFVIYQAKFGRLMYHMIHINTVNFVRNVQGIRPLGAIISINSKFSRFRGHKPTFLRRSR